MQSETALGFRPEAHRVTPDHPVCDHGSNDSFSFWKLDEGRRDFLTSEIEKSREDAEWFLFEKYLPERKRRPPAVMGMYYLLKGLIPQTLRHRAHAVAVRLRSRVPFPSWPREPALLALRCAWLDEALCGLDSADGWHIGFWPGGAQRCIVLTHDVEGPAGLAAMERMAEIEHRYGFRSAWNIPLAQFPVDWTPIERMRCEGFEFGAHGLAHDGRLFRNEAQFRALGPKLERLARDHGMRGFRAPSTLRRMEWLERLDFDFDSSFSDTDPYEPQAGGTCSLFPFFVGRMIELPYTLAQDHTLIHLLHREMLPVWIEKLNWIASVGGMILTLVHPDYSGSPPLLKQYEELLKRLSDIDSAWRALPSEVASWWTRRSAMQLIMDRTGPLITGCDTVGAWVERLSSNALLRAARAGLLVAGAMDGASRRRR